MTFDDGGLYERSFETPAGWIDVLAEVRISGTRLELRDVAFYPRGAFRLAVSSADLLRWVRLATAALLRISRTIAYEMAGQYEASCGQAGLPVIRLRKRLRVPRWALLELALHGRVVSISGRVAGTGERRRGGSPRDVPTAHNRRRTATGSPQSPRLTVVGRVR